MNWEQGKAILAMGGTLALMLLTLLGAWWVSRLVGRAGQLKMPGGSRVTVLERTPVGRDSSLAVVRAGDRVLLLGVTPHQIQKLDELDPALYPEGEAARTPPDFMDCLKKAVREKRGKHNGEDGPRQ